MVGARHHPQDAAYRASVRPEGANAPYIAWNLLKITHRENMKPKLTIETLQQEASKFAEMETFYDEPSLYGVTDGKKECTADFQTTKGLLDILEREGNKDDIIAFIIERNLPVDEIGAEQLADRIIETPPNQGYLTISNALQWRLQYGRVIQKAGTVPGISRVR